MSSIGLLVSVLLNNSDDHGVAVASEFADSKFNHSYIFFLLVTVFNLVWERFVDGVYCFLSQGF